MLAASAAITRPGASHSRPSSRAWSIPNLDHVTAALTKAEGEATTARAQAMASAPVCGDYKRMNVFIAKCKRCRRREADCQRSLKMHKTQLLCEKRVSEVMLKMTILNSAASLSHFMSERPGLVRFVGVRLLRYYDVNTASCS